eukprot:scaffold203673_cov41-Attheya_sp.AAC.1
MSRRESHVCCWLLLIVCVARMSRTTEAFVMRPSFSSSNRRMISSATATNNYKNRRTRCLDMCICIDCKWVTTCEAYHFVEEKHEQPHMTPQPTFNPRNGSPTIEVHIRTTRNEEEFDKMERDHAQETEHAILQDDGVTYMGSTQYDLSPRVEYEYDVIACEDFILQKDCWIQNMPQEIRDANPNFVPS